MEMIAMLDHQPLFAALDVSLEKTTVCVMSLDGAITKEAVVATDPEAIATCLSDDLGRLERVGVEAGPMSEWLVRGLADLGVSVVLMETRQVRAALSAMIVKTDRKDARGMAHLLRTGWFRPVHVKTVDAREQRACCRHARPWWPASRISRIASAGCCEASTSGYPRHCAAAGMLGCEKPLPGTPSCGK
jgi:hypothetical protein